MGNDTITITVDVTWSNNTVTINILMFSHKKFLKWNLKSQSAITGEQKKVANEY